jgi:hypothetical protein
MICELKDCLGDSSEEEFKNCLKSKESILRSNLTEYQLKENFSDSKWHYKRAEIR